METTFNSELLAYSQQAFAAVLTMAGVAVTGLLARYVPQALTLWSSASQYKIVQDALLWAAKEAVARLQDKGDTAVPNEKAAIDVAANTVIQRVPEALEAVGLGDREKVKDRVGARIKALLLDTVKEGVITNVVAGTRALASKARS